MEIQAPYFLVALPQLEDPIFSKTVVLIIAHETGGSFGLIINKVLRDENNALARMVAEVKDLGGSTLFQYEETVFEGGPVHEENLIALHSIEEIGTPQSQIGEELYLENETESFHKLLENDDYQPRRRFFLGSSQWSAGQLESEIRSGSWVVLPYDSKFLFSDPPTKENIESWQEEIWKGVLKNSGINPLTLLPSACDDSGYN